MRQLILRAIILSNRDFRKSSDLADRYRDNSVLFKTFKRHSIRMKQIELYCQERLSRNETPDNVIHVDFQSKQRVA